MTQPATDAAARYAASLRLSVAPMMDWTDRQVLQGMQRLWHINGTVDFVP